MKVLRPYLPSSSVFMATAQSPGLGAATAAAAATAQQQPKVACLAAAADRQASSLCSTPREADCTLSRLYEVVKGTQQQQLQQGLSPAQVQHICHIIENIKLSDLGLDPSLGQAMAYGSACSARELRARLRPKGNRGTVTYLDIHDDPAMTIGIFQLPPGARMPLHDHPGMTVFSRLLYGTLHVRAYDWVDKDADTGGGGDAVMSPAAAAAGAGEGEACGGGDVSMAEGGDASPCGSPSRTSSSSGSHNSSVTAEHYCGLGGSSSVQPARLVTDRVLTAPADTMVLFPASGGNIHAFTAISPCAILDVLTPPYGSRNCTYYREVFPPQWMDTCGQPGLVPSEDVASWVAWQAAGQQAADAPQQQPQEHNQQRQQHEAQQLGSSSCCSGDSNGGGGGEPGSVRYPDALAGGEGGRADIVVGLEVWKEPADFHVARGVYAGQRVL